jgi:hypothetical protein
MQKNFLETLITVACLGPDAEGFRPLYTLAGTLNPEVRRGDRVRVHGDLTGIFVGQSFAGVDWVVYEEEKFDMACINFDRKFAPREVM